MFLLTVIELNCEVYNVNNVTYGEEHNITFNSENGSLIHASVPFDKLSENGNKDNINFTNHVHAL